MQRMRNVFLGFRPPTPVVGVLEAMQKDLCAYYDSKIIHWVPPTSFYIPLRKLGPMTDKQIEKKKEAIQAILNENEPKSFILKLDSLEVSPSWNKPRALYSTVRPTPKTAVKKLAKSMASLSDSELLFETYEPIASDIAKKAGTPLKCVIGEWKKIYSPPLKGTAFRQGCLGFSHYASFEVNELYLMSEFPALDDNVHPSIEVLHTFPFTSPQEKEVEE